MNQTTDIQSQLFQLVKLRIAGNDTIGHALSEVLSISSDAVYRRYRGETALTIQEVKKICIHYNISFDDLMAVSYNRVTFTYSPLNTYDFKLESYLEGILNALKQLKQLDQPEIIISVNNTPLFQVLNFPQLVRFRLYFWAKTHLQIEAYEGQLFRHEKPSEKAFHLGKEILSLYNSIPSTEIYDFELMRGFLRQILYYFQGHMFEDPEYALFLCDRMLLLSEHLKKQAACGKKYIYGTSAPAHGNGFHMYLNETINTDSTFLYRAKERNGLFITHNIMNYLQTNDTNYVADTQQIIDKQIANSSLISVVNEKERNNFFHEFDRTIRAFRKRMETDFVL
jgi:hypothetical protein